MVGKVDPETLAARVFGRTGADDPSVEYGPAYGEDAAAIDLGETTLVVSTDPISLAAEQAGTLGVRIACNDVAASGGDPQWLTSTVFLPSTADDETLETIAVQLHEAAVGLDVSIVGGHSEYVSALDRPLLSLTALGTTDRFVPTGGAEPGDRVLLTKGAGIEATAILATDFRSESGVDSTTLGTAETYFEEISVVSEASALREQATAMHDPTEGGVLAGLVELAVASGVRIDVSREDVPVRGPTATLCDAMGVDPLRSFGSGALLATVPDGDTEAALDTLDDVGIDGAVIGTISGGESGVVLDGEPVETAVRDDLYALWE